MYKALRRWTDAFYRHVSLVYSSISNLSFWDMILRPWFNGFWRFGASYWLHFAGAFDKSGAEYPLTQRHILQEKDASATWIWKFCGPTLGLRVVGIVRVNRTVEQELKGVKESVVSWARVEEPLSFCLFIAFILVVISSALIFLSFSEHVFSKTFSADLRRSESEGQQAHLMSSECV